MGEVDKKLKADAKRRLEALERLRAEGLPLQHLAIALSVIDRIAKGESAEFPPEVNFPFVQELRERKN